MMKESMVRGLVLFVVVIAGYITAAQVVLASDPTAVPAPIWRVGDEWEYAYKSPSGSGGS